MGCLGWKVVELSKGDGRITTVDLKFYLIF